MSSIIKLKDLQYDTKIFDGMLQWLIVLVQDFCQCFKCIAHFQLIQLYRRDKIDEALPSEYTKKLNYYDSILNDKRQRHILHSVCYAALDGVGWDESCYLQQILKPLTSAERHN